MSSKVGKRTGTAIGLPGFPLGGSRASRLVCHCLHVVAFLPPLPSTRTPCAQIHDRGLPVVGAKITVSVVIMSARGVGRQMQVYMGCWRGQHRRAAVNTMRNAGVCPVRSADADEDSFPRHNPTHLAVYDSLDILFPSSLM